MKKLRLPHTLLLIYVMVVLTVVATWIIPGGEYQRVEKDGRMVHVLNAPSPAATASLSIGRYIADQVAKIL